MLRSVLRFSIRDLLWLALVVGLGVAWWADHAQLHRRLQAQNYQLKIFHVIHTKADELAVVLREAYQRDADSALDIAADPHTNTIIVRGPESKLLEAEAMVLQLDQKKD
jgi:type II secretory pathway component GspD/PulD (secretin)